MESPEDFVKSLAVASQEAAEKIKTAQVPSLYPALWMMNIKGSPYTLQDHFMFEPMFRLDLPRRTLFKCSRQVGKSQNLCGSRLLKSAIMPYYNILFVSPRFEQVKRLSNQVMRPLIETSPVKGVLLGEYAEQSILERSFASGSYQHYSFAFLDCDRIRGMSVSEVCIDEVQDINWDFLPIIAETLSGQKRWRNQVYTGTPKTFENTIEKLWQDSSMASWGTKCSCGYWNIASLEADLLKMIGKTTAICAKCGKKIYPQTGGWIHQSREKRPEFVGYHICQPVHPLQYNSELNWKEMLYKMRVYPQAKFYNECLGETWDSATRLMTLTKLKEIQQDFPNELKEALKRLKYYSRIVIGVDWGGGGGEETKSYTAVAVCGLRTGTDVVECIYARKLPPTLQPQEETKIILDLAKVFNPIFIAHDYGGAGAIREALLIQTGYPVKKLVPFTYVFAPNKAVIRHVQAEKGYRRSYTMDKPRSLRVLCTMMKAGKVRIPRWDTCQHCPETGVTLMEDFLNLLEDRQERDRGSDLLLVTKNPGSSDDMTHALNYACSCIWYMERKYPNISEALEIKISQEELNKIAPLKPNWQSDD
jgi:hypothetical protein